MVGLVIKEVMFLKEEVTKRLTLSECRSMLLDADCWDSIHGTARVHNTHVEIQLFQRLSAGEAPSLSDSSSLRHTSRFDTSPVSFAIVAWKGYDPFILRGTRLPCQKIAIVDSEFDHAEDDVLCICFRHALEGRFPVITELPVSGTWKAKGKDTRMTLAMDLGEALAGSLTAGFIPPERKTTGEEVSTRFDSGYAGVHKRDNIIVTLEFRKTFHPPLVARAR